jgi:hypothetical protein
VGLHGESGSEEDGKDGMMEECGFDWKEEGKRKWKRWRCRMEGNVKDNGCFIERIAIV